MMSIDLESSNSSFFDELDFDEADVTFLENNNICPEDLAAPTILDEIDEELFSMPDLLPDSESSLGLRAESLPNLYPTSRSASLSMFQAHEADDDGSGHFTPKRPSRVTPEPSPTSSSEEYRRSHGPSTTDLQRQYQLTLRKLAKSMRRSDATRSIVKRHKSWSYKGGPSTVGPKGGYSDNFFESERCRELEASRKQMLRFISI